MCRFCGISILFFVACAAFPQTAGRSSSSTVGRVIWEPPAWDFLQVIPKATVSKEMLGTFRLSDFPINLEKTEMDDVKAMLGGTLGQSGDAGDYVEWLCFHGTDPNGRWALWLESSEIDGGAVGSFQWQRLNQGAVLDRRCQILRNAKVELPIALRLGIAEAEVLKSLGRPTVRHGDRLIYVHYHQESFHGEPYDSYNIVAILLRAGRVWAIEVSKTTTS
jgi:hypothetical protein